MHEPLFMQAIEGFFLRRTGVGLSLSGVDWQRLRDWRALQVPATVILSGLDAALDAWRSSSPPHDLAFAIPQIEQAIRDHLQVLRAPLTAPPPALASSTSASASASSTSQTQGQPLSPKPSTSNAFNLPPAAPPAWAATPSTNYDAVKASLIRLGRDATSDEVRVALRQSFRAVLDAERRQPRPTALALWKTARAVALQALQHAMPDPELTALRTEAERAALPPRGASSLSAQALAARCDHQFDSLLAARFGVEALLSIPRAEVSR
jgi:hypothetical protein